MAARKKAATAAKAAPATEETPAEAPAVTDTGDGGAADLQALADDALSKGYFGTVPDPHPNEAYSLASGPASPSAASANPATRPEKKEGRDAR